MISEGPSATEAPRLSRTAGRVLARQRQKETSEEGKASCSRGAKPHFGSPPRLSFMSKATDFYRQLFQTGPERQGQRVAARTDGERRCVVLPLRENKHGNPNNPERRLRRLRRPVSELLNHFLLFGCVSESEVMKLLRKSCLSGQLPANQRPECTALAGAQTLPGGRATLGRSRRTRRRVEARGWAPRRRRQRCPARPPQLTPGC